MNEKKHFVDILFIVILIGLFATSSVAMALLGVNVYKTTASGDKDDLTTASLYFAQKIRQCDDRTSIRIANLEGETPALVISALADGNATETWLFVDNGSLKEVTVKEGSQVDREFGQEVMKLKSVDFNMPGDKLLQITITASEGSTDTVNLSLIGGGGN